MLRRLLYLAVAYYLGGYPTVQAIGVVLCSFGLSLYLGSFPYQKSVDNRLEIFNEMIVASCFVHLAFNEGTLE
jgi:hypothetical protein